MSCVAFCVSLCLLRSREYGSPQCRLRLYILGGRADVVEASSMDSMARFIVDFLPTALNTSCISDIIAWVPDILGHEPQLVCGLDKKDWAMLQGSQSESEVNIESYRIIPYQSCPIVLYCAGCLDPRLQDVCCY